MKTKTSEKFPAARRAIIIAGRRSSISIEDQFWIPFKQIAAQRGMMLTDLLGEIDRERKTGNLSSAIRVFVLRHYREKVAAKNEPERRAARPAEATLPGAPSSLDAEGLEA
jgi:predicted DNA-binding ribbon-helix-helix protein